MLETFEIHITADKRIHENLLGIKTITIENLKPDYSIFSVEHMTSEVVKRINFVDCLRYVEDVVDEFIRVGLAIERVKIECPSVYKHYLQQALYIESHFNNTYNYWPMSKNVTKPDSILGTAREYNESKYNNFISKWKHETIELCLYDTNLTKDIEWMKLYDK